MMWAVATWGFVGLTLGAYREASKYEQWATAHRRRYPALDPANYKAEFYVGRAARLVFYCLLGPVVVPIAAYVSAVEGIAERRLARKHQLELAAKQEEKEIQSILEGL